ncbi:solute carrier family protein [Trichophyton mentagrophytes]|nr:solute carrier family protein [Trichophyton mentagrophytes]
MAGDTIESARSTPSEGASTTRPLMKSADASVQPATDSTDDINSAGNSNEKQGYFAYFRTRQFYIVLLLGQILALCITATNTFSGLLSSAGTSIPAFQTLFNYILLTLVYTSFTLYRYGARKWWSQLVRRDWWKYLIFAFCDVQGNYFIVLAYRYTTILSAQLINFWAIVMVVLISFTLLRVRYHWAQYAGILVCIGGMGVLFGSDHITGANSGGPEKSRGDLIKGDLFALLGATFYGLTNVAEEYLVSKRPMYEVLGQLGMYATVIMGVQAAIFDRASFQQAVWNGAVAGYLVGYTLCLFLFYSLAPLLFRLASAAFFNISLLTSNFWGVVIGVKVFGLRIHFLYPIAFVLIIIGQFVYYLGRQVLGEAMKPWLGENQEQGVIGIGTARRAHNTNTPVTPAGTDSNV